MSILDNFKNPWANNYNDNSNLDNVLNNNANESDPDSVLNSLALQTDVLQGNDEVLGVGANEDALKDRAIELRATFIYCFDKKSRELVNLKDEELIPKIEYINSIVKAFFWGDVKQGIMPTKGKPNWYYCNMESLGKLQFQFYEDIDDNTEQGMIMRDRFNDKNGALHNIANYEKSNTKIKERGLKIICIREMGNSNSHAEKNGMFAYINYKHIEEFLHDGYEKGSTTKTFKVESKHITLLHEIGHLFGLDDRYQFMYKYKKDSNGCFEIVENYDIVPIPLNPDVEYGGKDSTSAFKNIMFGAYDNCDTLTQNQKNIILGIGGKSGNREEEENYKKTILLVPDGETVYSGPYIIPKTVEEKKLIAGMEDGKIYSYFSPDDKTKYKKDFLGLGIKKIDINSEKGSPLNDAVNDTIAGIEIQEYVRQTDKIKNYFLNKISGNKLALEILNNPNCATKNLNSLNNAKGTH